MAPSRIKYQAPPSIPPPFKYPTPLPLSRTPTGLLLSLRLSELTGSVVNHALSCIHSVLSNSPTLSFNLSHPGNHRSSTSPCTLSTSYGTVSTVTLSDLSYLQRRTHR